MSNAGDEKDVLGLHENVPSPHLAPNLDVDLSDEEKAEIVSQLVSLRSPGDVLMISIGSQAGTEA